MRWAVALAIALVAVPVTANPGLVVTFESPAQWHGDTSVTGEWALVYFLDGGARAAIDVDVGSATNESRLAPGSQGGAGPFNASATYPFSLPSMRRNVDAQVQQGLRFQRPGRGYLYVEAEAVEASLPTGDGTLANLPAGTDIGWGFPVSFQVPSYPRVFAATDSAAVGWGEAGASLFTLRAEGVRSIVWSNAEAECGAGPCLDGAGTFRVESGPDAPRGQMELESEWRATASGGTLAADGLTAGILVGGPVLDVNLDGSIRLPLADAPAACPTCRTVEDQSLRLEGALLLEDLAPFGDGRLQSNLGGDVVAARVDEQNIDPAAFLPATVGVLGVAAVGAVLLWKLLALLAFRDPLHNRTRRMVFDAVVAQPGATYRDLMATTGLGDGTVRHHLRVLRGAGLIAVHQQGGATRHFENHGRYDSIWQGVAGLRDDRLRDLYAWLQANPGARLRDMVAAWPDLPKSTTRQRLHRLMAWGIVEPDGAGYRVRFSQAPSRDGATD